MRYPLSRNLILNILIQYFDKTLNNFFNFNRSNLKNVVEIPSLIVNRNLLTHDSLKALNGNDSFKSVFLESLTCDYTY